MSSRDQYRPGAAVDAHVDKDGDIWTLVLVRDLRQPPTMVWEALTDKNQLREWAPFDTNRDLNTTGPVTLTTVGAPSTHQSESSVTRADAPTVLEYGWGGNHIRWELQPLGAGTRLTLWHGIHRKYVAMGAAGWHICFDVLEHLLAGDPLGRIVGGDAMKYEWPRLNAEYSRQFGIDTINPPTGS